MVNSSTDAKTCFTLILFLINCCIEGFFMNIYIYMFNFQMYFDRFLITSKFIFPIIFLFLKCAS